MSLIEYDLFGQKRDKVQTAIDRLRAFEPQEGYYVADSGGKDSSCVVKLCEIRYGEKDMPITDFCMKELCPKFGCPEFADQTMTSEGQDEFLSDCVFDGCPVATVYAALSGYGHLRDRLRKHEDAMEVSTQEDEREIDLLKRGDIDDPNVKTPETDKS